MKRGLQSMKRNRWITVSNCRTTMCSYGITGRPEAQTAVVVKLDSQHLPSMLSIRVLAHKLPPALFLLIVIWFMLHLLIFRQLSSAPVYLRPQNLSILVWHWPFGISYNLEGDICWSRFGIPGCFLNDNRSLFSQSDVVVFHHHELWTGHSNVPLHLPRPPNQKWLWLSLEPPIKNRNQSAYNGLFNWTMSYRRDADIFMPYGKLIPKKTNKTFLIPQKQKCLVSWVVSNYKQDYIRSKIFQQLKQYIPAELIEVYGNWNKRPLSAKKLLPTISRCYFYLAFENSAYQDYITEKLWRNSLQAGSVPLVYGTSRANYERLVPPDSFIHVNDFSSIKDLAAFLMQVASNKSHYEFYFKWHHSYEVKTYTDWRERFCSICIYYNQLPMHKVYHDLYSWGNK